MHPQRDQLLATYLQQMRNLRAEIFVAMNCIAGNALADFRESVARQEMLCAQLAATVNHLGTQIPSFSIPWVTKTEPAVAATINQEIASVRHANQQYAALLKHSGKSLALLSSLCKTHTGQHPEAREPRSKYETWSCEM